MTEWTSISVTEEQKETLIKAKPDEMAMGRFLVDNIDGDMGGTDDKKLYQREHEATLEEIREAAEQLERIENAVESGNGDGPVQLDATEYSKIANAVVGKLK